MNRRPFSLANELPIIIPRDLDECMLQSVDIWHNHFTNSEIFSLLYKNEYSVDWQCYVCKCPTKVDIKHSAKVQLIAMYCEDCKPQVFTQLHRSDIVLLRYSHSFYQHVKKTIIDNSNMRVLYK